MSDIAASISTGFRPPMTSSRQSTSGSVASARAISRRLRSPIGQRPGERSGPGAEAGALENLARSRPSASAPRLRPAAEVGADRHVRPRRSCRETAARSGASARARARRRRRSGGRRCARPRKRNGARRRAAARPTRHEKRVVLPAPFGPMTPKISPGATSNETAESGQRPPKRFVSAADGEDRLRHRRRSAAGAARRGASRGRGGPSARRA